MAKQVGDVEISMECQTCHMEVTTPTHHKQVDWNENHKANAIEELDQCITCHQEEKWIRRVRPQTMEQLLDPDKVDLKTYIPDEKIAESESRNTPFCFTCHSEKIPGYTER
ncbi:hypothetical protein H1D32_08035 [Anaerobacillus sp. CMMVII]|uniref:hypothetical protein n=1 Tax=Anaerobacillus sp. CMMVII TaxID=2755588 RepID=UPI0021B827F4|nr:hypothetical protein [Anaerobacillus sp. CMMVII]MCT8137711.1 hypothetical protein [Anaerobacillus sp. CMMVII]